MKILEINNEKKNEMESKNKGYEKISVDLHRS